MQPTDDKMRILLLERFNRREQEAFQELYLLIYNELYYYSNSLYRTVQVSPEDAVHDAFLYVWERGRLQFDSLPKIKSYLYLVIRNDFLSHVRRLKVSDNHRTGYLYDKDFYIYQAAEAEVYTLLPEALGMLPEDCARTLGMLLEGWNLREISEKTGLPVSTIHFHKTKAIAILRKKIDRDKFMMFIALLS